MGCCKPNDRILWISWSTRNSWIPKTNMSGSFLIPPFRSWRKSLFLVDFLCSYGSIELFKWVEQRNPLHKYKWWILQTAGTQEDSPSVVSRIQVCLIYPILIFHLLHSSDKTSFAQWRLAYEVDLKLRDSSDNSISKSILSRLGLQQATGFKQLILALSSEWLI